jgi:hypothetical protein
MALLARWAGGEVPSATKWNETSIPVVATTADISSPYTGQIVFATADTRLYRYTGTGWAAYNFGPTWALTRTTSQSITDSSWTTNNMLWTDERVDTGNMHSTSSNTDRVTITQAGLYSVTAKGSFAGNATGIRGTRLLLNGTADANVVEGATVLFPAIGTSPVSVPLPTVYIQLAVNDILRVQVFQNSGGALNTPTSTAPGDQPIFTGTWLRD